LRKAASWVKEGVDSAAGASEVLGNFLKKKKKKVVRRQLLIIVCKKELGIPTFGCDAAIWQKRTNNMEGRNDPWVKDRRYY
jgi:uncharacterized membrane protein